MTVPPQMVLLGDSLFEFSVPVTDGFSFYAELQNYYIRRYDVVNRGYSGWTTQNILDNFENIIRPYTDGSARIKYIAILLGANDACLPLPTTGQHVPIDKYRANLKAIISHPNLVSHNPQILLVTPPPLDEIKSTPLDIAAGHASATRTSAVTAAYSAVAREVAEQTDGVICVDLWRGLMDKAIEMEGKNFNPDDYDGAWLGDPKTGRQGGLDDLLRDGLHMTGLGYRTFYSILLAQLPAVSHDADARTDYVLPYWRTINPPSVTPIPPTQ